MDVKSSGGDAPEAIVDTGAFEDDRNEHDWWSWLACPFS